MFVLPGKANTKAEARESPHGPRFPSLRKWLSRAYGCSACPSGVAPGQRCLPRSEQIGYQADIRLYM